MINENVMPLKNGVLIKNADSFEPEKIFGCGQCFRWLPEKDGSFTGVVHGKVLNIIKKGEDVIIDGITSDEYESYWRSYFDMDRDYAKINDFLSSDTIISDAVSFGYGIRILKQDFFEAVISFIISANNNIPRIQGIIERLCKMFGEKILRRDGTVCYAFPTAEAMVGITTETLAPLRSGYRAAYIVKTVNSFLNGEIDSEYIASLNVSQARKELCKISGVGPKVADCILLFSLGRFDAFPTDVWIKRVMCELYGCEEGEAAALGCRIYGEYAGIAQQYLFFWRRGQTNL